MQAPVTLRRYLSETHFSVPEAVRLLSIHRAWLGQSLHTAAAAVKHRLIRGSSSNAFKGSFSVGFVLFSFQSFLGNTVSYPDVCARELGCGWFGLLCLGRGAEKRGDPGILGLRDNEVFGESVFSPPLVCYWR